MLIIKSNSTNPYFNIASEEYLLKDFSDDIFLLYINDPSIIVGKHQNTLAEINYRFVKENNIKVVRRLSGGGTVYHDHGNINFTFVQNIEGKNLIDFKKYTAPIISFLRSLGVNARFEGKNDLRVDGLKISGNAEHVFRKRVLHHGTLLFDSELDALNEAIRVHPDRYRDKGVKSIRSAVTNIRGYLQNDMTTNEFLKELINHVSQTSASAQTYEMDTSDIAGIQKWVDEKYASWNWNFGYSPKYELVNAYRGESNLLITIQVDKGFITFVSIEDESGNQCMENFSKALIGLQHKETTIATELQKLGETGSLPDDFVYAFL